MSRWTTFISWQYRMVSTRIRMYSLRMISTVLDCRFCETVLLTDCFVEFPSFHVLENQDDAVIFLKDFVNIDDVWVIQSDQHLNLVFG